MFRGVAECEIRRRTVIYRVHNDVAYCRNCRASADKGKEDREADLEPLQQGVHLVPVDLRTKEGVDFTLR